MPRRKRMGRPPRRDHPERMNVVLPRSVRAWLRRRARAEGRAMSDVLVGALELYRKRAKATGVKGS